MENQLKIPKLLGDNCVLQRGTKTRIWGKCIPGAPVNIALLVQDGRPMEKRRNDEKKGTSAECEQESEYIVARCAVTADETGAFAGYFKSLCGGGPYCLRFISGEEKAVSRNVYVGDVFVCGGQSNMELPMRRVRERYPEEFLDTAIFSLQQRPSQSAPEMDIAGGLPRVHLYKVQEDYDFKQEAAEHKNAQWGICRGSQREAFLNWEPQVAVDQREGAFPCSPDQLAEVSAFSYFLGKELSEEKGVPIGILNLSLGGTPIQAWMSEEGLKNWPQYLDERKTLESEAYCRELTDQYMEKEIAWRREIRVRELPWKDEYIKHGNSTKSGGADEDWKTLSLPGYLAEAGLENFCGTLLLRKKFQVSEACAGKEALLRLGTLTDADRTYINGVFVGDTGYCYPPRRYTVPAGVLKAGENEVLIYLMCRNGGGRMTKGKTIELAWEDVCSDSWVSKYAATCDTACSEGGCRDLPQKESRKSNGAEPRLPARSVFKMGAASCRRPQGEGVTFTAESPAPISLAGMWEYRVLSEVGPAPEQIFLNRGATGLFHGMAAPCLPYTVSGVVWYQGESNDCKPEEYQGLLPDMIADWRNRWMQETLPFVIVQLPNCGIDIAKDDAWPQIREAQRRAGSLPDVAVTVNIDIGEDNDLHPLNKKEAAHRAALALRRIVYHEDAVSEGPRLTGWEAASNAERFQNGCRDLPPTEGRGRYPTLQFDQELGILDCVTGQVFPADYKGDEGGQVILPFEFAGEDGIWQSLGAVISGKEIALVPMKTEDELQPCSGTWHEAFLKAAPQAGVDVREGTLPLQIRYAWSSAPGRYLLAAADDGDKPGNGGSKLPVSPFLLKLVPDKE
ncbi:MAG: sialate O-acetylesterase [Lachnospiraceae bacterium]|nr:sialate O-acetylesterase [Lachnospiraceae bacterium]